MTNNLQQKIDSLNKRSDKQLATAANNAKDGDFGSATALLVTAFEGRAKAVVLQFVDMGFPLVNQFSDLDYIFRHHDARHYIGFFVDCMYEVIEDVKIIFERCRKDKKYIYEVLKFAHDEKIQRDLLEWTFIKIESFLKKIDFYQNIEKTRQNGLYVDVLDNGGIDIELSEEDYLFVKSRLDTVHFLSADLKDMKKSNDQGELTSFEDAKQEMVKHDVPSYMANAILLIKKERNKTFNTIRKKLLEIREEL